MKYILLLLLMCSGCAELDINTRVDCNDKSSIRIRDTPASYPCECCPFRR